MSAYYDNYRMGNGRLTNNTYYGGDKGRGQANGQAGQSSRKPTRDEGKQKPFILNRFSNAITSALENGFYWIGHLVGFHPWKTVFISAFVMGSFGAGFYLFKDNTDSTGLWVPNDAEVLEHKDWVSDNFPSNVRSVAVLFVASDVLAPEALKKIYDFYKKSLDLKTSSNKKYTDVCLKSGNLCRVNSVLELWKYNETDISGITSDDVKSKLNNTTQSPTYFNDFDPTTVLGGTTKDSSGNIIAARAAKVTWLLQGGSVSSTELDDAKLWEEKAVNLALKGQDGISNVYVTATRSFSDKAGDAISSDVVLLSTGYLLVIVFVIVILGRFNFLEFGLGISVGGILVIGISIVFSYGLASIAGWEYTPLHSILPFLLLGIGVDDLFVVVMAYKSLPPAIADKPIPERIAMTLKHAGVSITVTSLTDMCAFGIGATTVLPALRSFCIFACLGIFALYLLSATFFVACVALNAQRHDANRNSVICCLKHSPQYHPNQCSRKEIIVVIFKKFYGPILTTIPAKVFVILSTLALLGVGIWGFVSLKQESDPIWFLPTDSYPFIYDGVNTDYFPSSGESASVYCKAINYFQSKDKFAKLQTDMTSSKYIASGTTDSWFKSYTDWLSSTTDANITAKLNNSYPVNETDFYLLLHQYVTTVPTGLRHKRQIVFANTSTLTITASYIPFRHPDLKTSYDKVKAMDSTTDMVEKIFTSGECFPYGRRYLNWYTNKVIQTELYRNLGIAAACVFLVCLVLIANIFTSLLVFSCVVFTLLDVGGMMHFWNMTIDTVTSIILILAIGLAVDYSAHIGHCFMTFRGNRNDRVKATLVEMGSPVFSGGFSTFLAFILLVGSNSYVFTTFFKVFFLVVLFGLFHGLVYLPTMLSLIGPSPYLSADRGQTNQEVSLDIRADGSKVSVQGVDNPVMNIKRQKLAYDGPPAYDFWNPVKDVTAYIPPPDYSPPSQPRFYRGPVDRQNIYSIR